MLDVIFDSFLDTVKTLPFLIGAYLLIEWIAHRAGDSFKESLGKMGILGALGGAVLGLIPQCGFSVAAASFYADRIITPGTLMAVFIATSDEAIPVLLANPGSGDLILKLMGIKLLLAMVIGLAVDFGLRRFWKPVWNEDSELRHDHIHMRNLHGEENDHYHSCGDLYDEESHPHHAGCDHSSCDHCTNQLCEHCCSHTHCHGSVWKTALENALKIALLIFIVTAVLNLGFEALGEERTASLLMSGSVFQPVIASLFGLIPSCASSVVLTQLYIEGSIGFGSVIAGLFTGAGTGILILFQAVRNKKESLLILAGLFTMGSIVGIILG